MTVVRPRIFSTLLLHLCSRSGTSRSPLPRLTRRVQSDPWVAPDIRIRFGRAIRRVREEQKITQEEAAERCGLHRTYYSGVERGIRNVALVNIEKIARGLKRSLPELFGGV